MLARSSIPCKFCRRLTAPSAPRASTNTLFPVTMPNISHRSGSDSATRYTTQQVGIWCEINLDSNIAILPCWYRIISSVRLIMKISLRGRIGQSASRISRVSCMDCSWIIVEYIEKLGFHKENTIHTHTSSSPECTKTHLKWNVIFDFVNWISCFVLSLQAKSISITSWCSAAVSYGK